MTKKTGIIRRLAGPTALAVLGLGVAAVTGAPVHAATGSPQHCQTVTTGSDPAAVRLAGLLGVAVPPDAEVGLSCAPATDGTSQVNFCATENAGNGLLVIGKRPIGHTCA